jgi:hypothetical protein
MAKHHEQIRVRAKVQGLYGQLREPGAEFPLTDEAHFSGRWMEHVDEKGAPVKDSPLQEAYDDRQDYAQRRATAIALKQGAASISEREIDQLAPPKRKRAHAAPGVDASDLGVYAEDGTLIREQQTGSPLVQRGAVGHPGQDDQSKPRAFDARHEIEQDFSQPHQLKDGTAKDTSKKK